MEYDGRKVEITDETDVVPAAGEKGALCHLCVQIDRGIAYTDAAQRLKEADADRAAAALQRAAGSGRAVPRRSHNGFYRGRNVNPIAKKRLVCMALQSRSHVPGESSFTLRVFRPKSGLSQMPLVDFLQKYPRPRRTKFADGRGGATSNPAGDPRFPAAAAPREAPRTICPPPPRASPRTNHVFGHGGAARGPTDDPRFPPRRRREKPRGRSVSRRGGAARALGRSAAIRRASAGTSSATPRTSSASGPRSTRTRTAGTAPSARTRRRARSASASSRSTSWRDLCWIPCGPRRRS